LLIPVNPGYFLLLECSVLENSFLSCENSLILNRKQVQPILLKIHNDKKLLNIIAAKICKYKIIPDNRRNTI
jgi:hypothetical protein